ncbi:excisionase family DNA binding protein [Bacillus sp. SLBN-46]|uniref:helix-turn-helix domain-containing protein n=1 Tax=Bacillus sp. SLBN-46 TaxID=3042283 RepID=UPI00285E0EA2|nr:helix-turn-helix domain-containing protein [Bacillus sp. SLBN-46]MDR6124065.1 excisionase family DNA binding protein [Bacillus sp. SLBN-46]
MKGKNNKLNELPDVLTVKDLKELFGIGRVQAYELANKEDVPSKRIGRRILIYKANLIKWLEQNTAS